MDEKLVEKIRKYCAYRDRSQKEVRQKMALYRISYEDQNKILSQLEKESFLDEERFVRQFIKSKISLHRWGRIKIKNQLQQKGIDEKLIRKYLDEIDEDEYENALRHCMKKWLCLHSAETEAIPKLYRFLLSKGFEYELINNTLKNCDYD